MPDIISRIRVEASGADQAAREIRKLRDAYNEVGQAARNLSPGGIGADPFAQAVSAPGGGVYGGQRAPADITDRETRGKNYQDQVRDRETANTSFNASMRQFPSTIQRAGGMAEAVSRGQYGTAAGQGLTGLGTLLGGPLGIGLLAGGAFAVGGQKLAQNEMERVRQLWGSGQAQRLGISYERLKDWQAGMGIEGIPLERVGEFIQAASQSGFMANKPGASSAAGYAMEAAAMMGVNPAASAAMLGAMSKGGINLGMANYDLWAMMKGTFGTANVGTFVNELTRSTESALKQGIRVTPEEAQRHATMIGAFSEYGGLSPEGAVGIAQMAQQRARGATQLQRPEDIIAFQAMRSAGMSVTDALVAMEESPWEVNKKVFDYLKTATGGDEELMAFRMQSYLGPGTTMSATRAVMSVLEEVSGKGEDEIKEIMAAKGKGWQGQTKTEEGFRQENEQRRIYSGQQLQLLRRLEKSALDMVTFLADIAKAFTGEITLNALDVTFASGLPGRFMFEEDRAKEEAEIYGAKLRLGESLGYNLETLGMPRPGGPPVGSWDYQGEFLIKQYGKAALEQTLRTVGTEGAEVQTQRLVEIMQRYIDFEARSKEEMEVMFGLFMDELKKRGFTFTDGDE
jgi:hypothetical protein